MGRTELARALRRDPLKTGRSQARAVAQVHELPWMPAWGRVGPGELDSGSFEASAKGEETCLWTSATTAQFAELRYADRPTPSRFAWAGFAGAQKTEGGRQFYAERER